MPPVTRVALDTLGCKLNQAETDTMARELAGAGFCLVTPEEQFDVYILNTCTVTGMADAKSRHLLRLAHRRSPRAALVVTGCYTESARGVLESLPGVRLVLPNSQKSRLVSELLKLRYPGIGASLQAGGDGLRTRAFVKAQEGCSNFCAYCIVPYVRGKESSRPPSEVIQEIDTRVREGYKEAVLTGTEIGSYRNRQTGLEGLVRRILRETAIARLRLSSLQPQEVTGELLGLWEDSRLCPHFHLSLQSGSDTVLRRMNRRYDSGGYRDTVARIRSVSSDAGITTDVIAGFPGESDAEFEESYRFCESIGFSRIHVFTFSLRPGTLASCMPGQVQGDVKKERSRRLLALAKESAGRFHTHLLGKTLDVLWERESQGVLSGYTGNYVRAYARGDTALVNRITGVKLEKLYRDGVWGRL